MPILPLDYPEPFSATRAHHQGIAPCVVYEFDFDRKGNKSYQPSFAID
jgi:hypothetical protein